MLDGTVLGTVVGYDGAEDGQITVWVACASEDVKNAIEDGWNRTDEKLPFGPALSVWRSSRRISRSTSTT